MSIVYLIDNEGGVTEFSYSLPPLQAIQCAVQQHVHKNYNTAGYISIETVIKETERGYSYPFSDNSALWVRK